MYSHSRCSPGLVPNSITESSRWIPVCPGFTTFTLLASRLDRCRPGYDPVFVGIENNRDWGESRRHRDKPCNTMVKSFQSICPCGVPVHPCEVPEKPVCTEIAAGVHIAYGLRRVVPVYHGRVPMLSRFLMLSHRFYPVFTSLTVHPGSPRLY